MALRLGGSVRVGISGWRCGPWRGVFHARSPLAKPARDAQRRSKA